MSTQPDPVISSPLPAPFSTGTTLADAQLNQLESSKIMVAALNGNLKTLYLTAFNNWAASVNAGRIPNTNPPQPPPAYIVSQPDANGFQWPIVGKQAVCDVPPIPADHFTPAPSLPKTVPGIGHWSSGNWYSCLHNNTWDATMGNPPGQTMPITIDPSLGGPAADGQPHIFQFYPAPVGEGWWLMTR